MFYKPKKDYFSTPILDSNQSTIENMFNDTFTILVFDCSNDFIQSRIATLELMIQNVNDETSIYYNYDGILQSEMLTVYPFGNTENSK